MAVSTALLPPKQPRLDLAQTLSVQIMQAGLAAIAAGPHASPCPDHSCTHIAQA